MANEINAGSNPSLENLGGDKSGKANLFLVDPNPPGRGIVPAEDMFMYVKLRAIRKNRSVLETTGGASNVSLKQSQGTDGEINFIATKVDRDTNGNIMNDGFSYTTTDWTNIGGKVTDSRGVLEGFGVNSINITYGASLVPQVDITFTDLRGSSLFNVIDKDNRQSPYSIFFSLPYPIFELTVKGYFGKAVTYCLHMTKANFDFDGSTGNFNIKANFVGFQQAFLADMVLGNVIGVVNTREGSEALSRTSITDSLGNIQPTPKLDDFIKKISNISELTKDIKGESDTFTNLKNLNTELSKIRQMRSFLGTPTDSSGSKQQTTVDGGKSKNKASRKIISDDIGYKGLTKNIDYVIIRDILVVKSQRSSEFKDFAEKAINLYTDYTKTFNESTNDFQNFIFSKSDDGKIIINDDNEIYNKYNEEKQKQGAKTFKNFYDTFLTEKRLETKNNWKEGFDFTSIPENRNNFVGEGKFSLEGDDIVFAVDLYPVRDKLDQLYREKKERIDKLQKDVIIDLNKKLSQKIEFNPTIRYVTNIIVNNVQAMLSTLYDVSRKAEVLKEQRLKALQGVVTDVDVKKSKGLYAWPDVVQTETEQQNENKWLGDIIDFDDERRSLFPEIQFVEDVLDGYLTSKKRITEGSENAVKGVTKNDSNNWMSVSPYDYNENPYFGLNDVRNWDIKSPKGIPEYMINEIINRVILLTTYSKFDKNILEYSALDGAYAALNMLDDKLAKVVIENLNGDDVIRYAEEKKLLKTTSEDTILVKNNLTVSGFDLNGTTGDSNSFLYIKENLSNSVGYDITNKTKPLNTTILNKEKGSNGAVTKIETVYKSKDDEKGIKGFEYFLPTLDISYHKNIWGESVASKIKPTPDQISNNNYGLSLSNINILDGERKDNGESSNNYIGVASSKDSRSILETKIYSGQTSNAARALMLLNTLPFKNTKEENKYDIKDFFKDTTKVVKLPKYYLLWICGSIWRYKESGGSSNGDPLKWAGSSNEYEFSQPSLTSYLFNVGDKKLYSDSTIDTFFLSLPPATKQMLIDYYLDWVNRFFTTFENLIRNYTESIKNSNKIDNDLLTELSQTVNVVSITPRLWEKKLDGNLVKKSDIETYVNQFSNYFTKYYEEKNDETNPSENDDGKNSALSTTNNSDLKNVLYQYFKNVYDKWIGGTENGKVFNVCGPSDDEDLITYFKFISRSWCDIGDTAVVNLNSVASLTSNFDTNVYFYLAKILRDSNFLLQILPSYVNFKDPQEVIDMFKPITNVDKSNRSTGPIYACIYAGGNSKTLDIPDGQYKDDGFNMRTGEVPEEFTGCNKPNDPNGLTYNLVAFRVAFGSENQTIFKNVNLNQEEHRETGEYFKVLGEYIDNRGGSKRNYQGTDLYQIYQARSYKCKIDALGCMNIQPLMYFQLDNVPFFKGAYLITNVSHSITPNHITTNFEGVRQTKITTPVVDNATTFLNINFDEENERETIDLTPPIRNFAPWGVLDPGGNFTFNLLNSGFLSNQMGVPNNVANTLSNPTGTNTQIGNILTTFGITTNAQVTMFMAAMLYEGNDFKPPFVESWDNPNIDDNGVARNGTKEQLAYGSENNTLGNTEPGDGYKFRGRGFVRLTGRKLYEEANKKSKLNEFINVDLTSDEGLNLLSVSPEQSLAISAWYWKKENINDVIKSGKGAEFTEVIKKINSKDTKNMKERYEKLDIILDKLNLKDIFNV